MTGVSRTSLSQLRLSDSLATVKNGVAQMDQPAYQPTYQPAAAPVAVDVCPRPPGSALTARCAMVYSRLLKMPQG